ncbi:MAG: endolytic transglycosylase MltG [Hyphomicrobiales bacterium]
MNGASPRLIALAVGLIIFAALMAGYAVSRTPGDLLGGDIVRDETAAPSTGQTVAYTVAEGATASSVGADLERLGVIDSSRQFELLVRLMGVQDQLSAGNYTLPRGAATLTVIDMITVKESGPVVRVTFPEGIRIEEMAEIAERAGIGTKQEFLDAVANFPLPPELAEVIPPADQLGTYQLQGYLFPDTYILPRNAKPERLVALMVDTFLQRFSSGLRAAAEAQGLNMHQAVTLASIVEREAVIPSERPLIAGVFMNRIRAGDRLGADPTTQFAVALDPNSVAEYGWWKRELTQADVDLQSPYNTRQVTGLPPGPIANPGLASLEAVAHPEVTKMYYFVANAKKGDGAHVFAETFEQHQANIAEFGSP